MEKIFIFKVLKLLLAISAIFMLSAFISAMQIIKKCNGEKKDDKSKSNAKQVLLSLILFAVIFFGIQAFYVWRVESCDQIIYTTK
jgi:hypothetical protein